MDRSRYGRGPGTHAISHSLSQLVHSRTYDGKIEQVVVLIQRPVEQFAKQEAGVAAIFA